MKQFNWSRRNKYSLFIFIFIYFFITHLFKKRKFRKDLLKQMDISIYIYIRFTFDRKKLYKQMIIE